MHYHGDRSPEAILQQILTMRSEQAVENGDNVLKAMSAAGMNIGDEAMKRLAELAAKTDDTGCGPEADTVQDTGGEGGARRLMARAEGCEVSGMVEVQKVPGNLLIRLTSDGHSFQRDSINVSHVIHSLTFGEPLSTTQLVSGVLAAIHIAPLLVASPVAHHHKPPTHVTMTSMVPCNAVLVVSGLCTVRCRSSVAPAA